MNVGIKNLCLLETSLILFIPIPYFFLKIPPYLYYFIHNYMDRSFILKPIMIVEISTYPLK